MYHKTFLQEVLLGPSVFLWIAGVVYSAFVSKYHPGIPKIPPKIFNFQEILSNMLQRILPVSRDYQVIITEISNEF